MKEGWLHGSWSEIIFSCTFSEICICGHFHENL